MSSPHSLLSFSLPITLSLNKNLYNSDRSCLTINCSFGWCTLPCSITKTFCDHGTKWEERLKTAHFPRSWMELEGEESLPGEGQQWKPSHGEWVGVHKLCISTSPMSPARHFCRCLCSSGRAQGMQPAPGSTNLALRWQQKQHYVLEAISHIEYSTIFTVKSVSRTHENQFAWPSYEWKWESEKTQSMELQLCAIGVNDWIIEPAALYSKTLCCLSYKTATKKT